MRTAPLVIRQTCSFDLHVHKAVKLLVLACLLCILSSSSGAYGNRDAVDLGEDELVRLWPPGAVPGALGQGDEHNPSLYVYRPPQGTSNGAAVVVVPGGAYHFLALLHEGRSPAVWLTDHGFTALVLQYRLGRDGYRHEAIQKDILRAMRLARHNASAWGYARNRIAVMGFSAGGHLASEALTHFDDGDAAAADPVDREPSRPDLGILGYPVITMRAPTTHKTSHDMFLGEGASAELEAAHSSELNSDTPPVFLFTTRGDGTVNIANTLLFAEALRAKEVSFESHVYETKEPIHGVGIGLKGDRAYAAGQSAELQLGPGEAWTDRAGKLHPWTQDLLRWLALREGWEPRLPARAQAAATSG